MLDGIIEKFKNLTNKKPTFNEASLESIIPEHRKLNPQKRKHNVIPENGLFLIKSFDKNEKKQDYSINSTGIKEFDNLITDNGLEKNSSILISGGAGTGKTTFSIQSIYYSAIEHGERGIYLSFEEEPEKIKLHMKKNFGWDLNALEKKGLFAIIKIDPVDVARAVEQVLANRGGELKIDMKKIELPFLPDKIAIDSLSALSIAFTEEDSYRKYIRELFESVEELNCTSYVISETEQDPKIYSRTGVEEFLADGVIVLYNLKKDGQRENAIEILKLRSSAHKKGMTPYKITKKGITILEN
ncbi:MAG: hypothetical protein NUV57_04325 [archaeon]|nr:hypothetical protein [archaeon]